MSRLLIDGDTVLIKSLFAVKDKFYGGLRACNFTLENILSKFDYPEFVLGLGGYGNFRKEISSEYKSNRDPSKLPKYLYEGKEYLKKYWGARQADGMETDDLLAIEQEPDDILVVQDKDYLQLGGKYFDYWKGTMFEVDNPAFYFYRQLLVGDRSDNIPGLTNPEKLHFANPPNFTDPTATKVLENKSPEEMRDTVQGLYQQIYGEDWFGKYDVAARLLFLRRKNATEYFQVF